jgi:5-methylthioribose kinase
MPSNIDLNKTLFHVGIVKNTEHEFKVKMGLTKELCDVSKTLTFSKHPPFANKDHYMSLGRVQPQLINVLRQNDWQNFGVAEQPDDVIYSLQYIFTLNQPRLPLTRL